VGIHLVKKFIDEIDYEYQDGTSKITLIKYLEKRNV
jgi:anti-sigma regulatory factor (Ser/Thr protein kinase)